MDPRSSSSHLRAALFLAAAIAFLVALPAPSSAQPPRSELIRERLKTRPNEPTLYYYYLALAEFSEGDKPGGLEALEQVASIGNGLLPVRDVGFAPVWDDSAFQAIFARLEQKLPKVVDAREAFTLDEQLIPEGIAYDPASRSYYVGSIATAKIVRVDAKGTVSDFSRPGELKQVLGLAIDARKRQLHAVSTSLVGTPDSTSNQLVTYDLATGARVRSIAVPMAAQLNDVAVGLNGELFVTDSRAGGVFRIRPTSGTLDTIAAPPTIPGVNGITLSADGRALYFAHSTGVARYELATRELLPRIEIPAGESVGAIDGLYVDGNALVGVQNVTNPGRVIRLPLRADGKAAERVETLLSHHHPAIDEPTTGAIVGRSFALLATTQVGRFTPEGTVTSPETLKRPVVLLVPLDPKR